MTSSKPTVAAAPLLVAVAALAIVPVALATSDGEAMARVAPVVDDYFGTTVSDPYRWMETPDSPELQGWLKQQADRTRAALDHIPARERLKQRIHELDQATSEVFAITRTGDRYFYFRREPGEVVPKIMYRDGIDGAETLLLDPAKEPGPGGHAEAGWFEPSKDGRYLAVGMQFGGTEEAGHLRVIDVARRERLGEDIPRVWAGDDGGASWLPDNRSFVYAQFPEEPPQERLFRARALLHALDRHPDGRGDPPVFGFGVDPAITIPKENFNGVAIPPGSDYAIAVSSTVDVDVDGLYVAPIAQLSRGKVAWKRIATHLDQWQTVASIAVHGDAIYLVSRKNAPRNRVVSTSLLHPDLRRPKVVVAQSPIPIEDIAAAADGLYVLDLDGGPSRLRRLPWSKDASEASTVALPFIGAIRHMTTDPRQPGALLRMRSWTRSNQILQVDGMSMRDTGWQDPAKLDFSDIDAREVTVASYDGTRIPLSIVVRKGAALDGSHPTLIESYGAYGVFGSAKPAFDPVRLAWLERGGVIAIAHPRGGGEFGEEWHRAGMKQTKLNTVFDTIACAQYLVDARYTSPSKLAIYGASAGGIVVGGAIAWRPDLFAAAIDHSGMSDTLRFETAANGLGNVPEFGSTKTPEGFHALYAMSPYHHLRDRGAYPAVLLETGATDPRVEPWQMAKMAARLQAAQSSPRPVLLRVDFDTGHFLGTTEQTEQVTADEWSFLLWQFGDPEFQPAP